MRAFIISLVVALVFASLHAQQAGQGPAQAMKTFASLAEVRALAATAKSERKEGQALVVKPILQLPTYNVNLEYRTGVASANVHEREGELFYVIDGSATLITSGRLVNERRTNPENRTGSAVEGGTARHVAVGDFFLVPENTPHWFSAIDGTITMMSVHIPVAKATP
jgi:mannose-6-phosphate isomerase-like protein (cupin superfamily)